MTEYNLMKQALAEQWELLPEPLKKHYQAQTNQDVGKLSVDFPGFMQPVLSFLRLFGVLLSCRGKDYPIVVQKRMKVEKQYWERTIQLQNGKSVKFKTTWVYAGKNRLIEYVNPFFGLCMEVSVEGGRLYYEGKYFVLNFGWFRLPVFEWLLLGHTRLVEHTIDDERFEMDFRLIHPVFGQVYRYYGTFSTALLSDGD